MQSKTIFILLIQFLMLPAFALCQTGKDTIPAVSPNSPVDTNDVIYQVVEEPASFPGGMDALNKYLVKNLVYPDVNKEGTAYVTFVVEKDGSISNVAVRKGIDPQLDQAAMNVVKKMPRWIPGKQSNKPVRTIFILPIQFSLEK
ncbi:MAG TPA: energy transducer TonB [Bacteroidales bacterium]|nr:energy transducer TonB [Bacteroidales bacterium]HRZ49844.1 energy transducer TonB [Bacteroidales bacterium]